MLDPFTCLNIATAVAQFIDFSASLLKAAHKIQRNNGSPEEVANFEQRTVRFKSLCVELQDTRKGKVATEPRDGHCITTVAADCEKLAVEISEFLDGLKLNGKTGTLNSLKLAYKARKTGPEFETYRRLLMERKMELSLELLKMIDRNLSGVSDMVKRLEERDLALQTNLLATLENIKAELRNVADARGIAEHLSRFGAEAERISKTQFLILSFQSDILRAREQAVCKNHAGTFRWIFEPEPYKAPTAESDFVQWLRTDANLFWITGKAGSGKSTLMKYLYEHSRARDELGKWAGDRKLVISRHFFWNAGTAMQKSSQGLLLSLCYDIFCACPDLLEVVVREKWSSLERPDSAHADVFVPVSWTESDLRSILLRLGNSGVRSQGRQVCFCFFIDGLDEYQWDHEDIAELVCTLSQLYNVKVCVSSRPWNVFGKAFGTLSKDLGSLYLQDLTRGDIVLYVRERLQQDPRFIEMQAQDARCSDLAIEITNKAQGVFLWVILVVSGLLTSLTNADDFYTLQRRLRVIPPDLEEYFQQLFDTLDGFYRVETAQALLIMMQANRELPLLAFSVLYPGDPDAAHVVKNASIEALAKPEQLNERLATRIRAQCRDLLEVDDCVRFLHRSVRDFLFTHETKHTLSTRSGSHFYIDEIMAKVSLITLGCCSFSIPDRKALIVDFFVHCRNFEDQQHRSSSDLHSTFRRLTSRLGQHKLPGLPEQVELLALMNVPLELEKCMDEMQSRSSPLNVSRLNRLLWQALSYLSLKQERTGYAYDGECLLMISRQMDPERRGFRPATVEVLLRHGAESNHVWPRFLRLMYEDRECPHHRRQVYLKVSQELLRAGAWMGDALVDGLSEEKLLVKIFGQGDALTLQLQRKAGHL